ncbi:flagellin N-terminal helical domain-containing protein [Priestia aryabhattai]|uniref:flagellin N-terminal helical domain-containing protein n=1 Tax=Priestia aryabhattai TaxID=412384 RepID=UPI0027DF3F7F|nr:flagellin [Priestia aryabhattai]
MRINHNIAALNTYRQLNSASTAQSKSMEKLSSGLRINNAADDAAGLAISEKMRGQIRGLDMASKNAQDATSLIQTAEGALNETHDILQRMRELATQASNDTNTSSDRNEIQKEINQLTEEVDRIGNNTEFNTKKLLNGEVGVKSYTTAPDDIKNVQVSSDTKAGTYSVTVNAVATNAQQVSSAVSIGDNLAVAGAITAGTALEDTAGGASFANNTITINGKSFTFDGTATFDDIKSEINKASGETGVTVDHNITNSADATDDTVEWTFKSTTAGSDGQVAIAGTSGIFAGSYTASAGVNADVSVSSSDATVNTSDYKTEGNKVSFTDGDGQGIKFNVENTNGGDIVVSGSDKLSFQIGANKGQNIEVAIQDMRSSALGVNSIDVSSYTSATDAIETINNAIETVSAERSKLGSYQNRLDHTINNLNTSSENLTSAESRIRDVDYALAA